MAQMGGLSAAYLLRALRPATALAALPAMAADHGLRPEAQGFKMAQASPGRTDGFIAAVGHKQKRGASWAEALRRLNQP